MEAPAGSHEHGPDVWGGSLGLALVLTTVAGLSTGIGGLIVACSPVPLKQRTLGLWQGAAGGFMIAVTSIEILPDVLQSLPYLAVLLWASLGGLAMILLKGLLPEPDLSRFVSTRVLGGKEAAELNSVLWSGLLTAVSLAAHNFPEGIAVAVAGLQGLHRGLPLALAIAVHNIPEGLAVAMPVYFATQDRKKALLVALLSGLAEPLGVVFVFAIGHRQLTSKHVASLLAAVGGIMVALSAVELIPQSVKLSSPRGAATAFVTGFLIMATLLGVLHLLGLG